MSDAVLQLGGSAHLVSSCATLSEAAAAFCWAQLRDSASPLSCMLSCTQCATSAEFSAALVQPDSTMRSNKLYG